MPVSPDPSSTPAAILVLRSVLGGVLMGLANLVPGISGGTMLLAAGVYPPFVGGVAEITTLRFRRRSTMVVGVVVLAAVLGILLLAGPVKDLVVTRRWVMYSLFIGLTLGGLPVVWRMARPARRSTWIGAALGFLCMILLALAPTASGAEGGGTSLLLLLLAGLAGASAMILPGVSGSYLLLVLGQYLVILGAVDRFKEALRLGDRAAALEPAVGVLLPVGIGVVAGVVLVSNLVRWLLRRHASPTLGFLMGLLLGAVVGLWPFQQSVEPVVGETVVHGRLLSEEMLATLAPEDLPTERFRPGSGQVAGSLGLILVGFSITALIARLGGSDRPEES